MKRAGAASWLEVSPLCLLMALAFPAIAEQLYVTEKLVVGIYANPALDGERLAVVRSADAVEVLAREEESAQVRLADGTEGWMKASYLESEPPLAQRISELESENRRLRGTASKPDQAAGLQKENTQLRGQLESAQRELEQLRNQTPAQVSRPEDDAPIEIVKPTKNPAATTAALVLLTAAAALGGGFAWGYFHLDRRIRRKFGGLKPW
jgi:hypothetical protein